MLTCKVKPAALFRTSAAAVVAGGVLAAPMPAARAVDAETWTQQFYSFIPAAKRHFPNLGDIALWKSDMADGRKDYKAGKFGEARQHFEHALDNGNFVAAWYLGHIYRLGLGVKPDARKAIDYYSILANRYHPDEPRAGLFRLMVDSMVHLADYYRDGVPAEGIRKDPYRAFDLYNIAASHGHPAGHYGLALMYLRGDGVKRSPRRALRWLMVAANRHYAPAKALLGDLFWRGEVVRQDRTEALKWYELAIQTARTDTYPGIYSRLDKMLAEATPEERASAETRAAKWSERNPVPSNLAVIAPASGNGD